jgi:hypothetical protein
MLLKRVMPAQAGIQSQTGRFLVLRPWIPAFAGMTAGKVAERAFQFPF